MVSVAKGVGMGLQRVLSLRVGLGVTHVGCRFKFSEEMGPGGGRDGAQRGAPGSTVLSGAPRARLVPTGGTLPGALWPWGPPRAAHQAVWREQQVWGAGVTAWLRGHQELLVPALPRGGFFSGRGWSLMWQPWAWLVLGGTVKWQAKGLYECRAGGGAGGSRW